MDGRNCFCCCCCCCCFVDVEGVEEDHPLEGPHRFDSLIVAVRFSSTKSHRETSETECRRMVRQSFGLLGCGFKSFHA